jgi:predicted phosphodiesterase
MISKATEDFLRSIRGPFIMHISDTLADSYANVEKLLKQIRPTLLIHTGDLADEFKVGRIPEHLPGYREAVARLLEIMKENAQEVWITHGNNDDVPWLMEDKGIRVLPMKGSSQTYHGLRLYLQHQPIEWVDENLYDFALYGHGYTMDIHNPEDNKIGKLCYINGMRHATIINPFNKHFRHIPYAGEEE